MPPPSLALEAQYWIYYRGIHLSNISRVKLYHLEINHKTCLYLRALDCWNLMVMTTLA